MLRYAPILACPNVGVTYSTDGDVVIGSADNIADWQNCGKACKESAGCNYWTWRKDSGKCRFLSGKSSPIESSNIVSGVKNCGRNSRNVLYLQNHLRLKRSIGKYFIEFFYKPNQNTCIVF